MKQRAITILSVIFALAGICRCFWFLLYDINEIVNRLASILAALTPYNFSYVFEDFSLRWKNFSYPLNLLNLYCYLSFLTGALVYAFSKRREIRLLRFNYALIILGYLISFPFIITHFFIRGADSSDIAATGFNPLMYLVNLLICGFIFFTAYQALAFFKKESPLEISVEQDLNGQPEEYLLPATRGQRFVNYFVDDILITIYMITTIRALLNTDAYRSSFENTARSLGNEATMIILFLIARFLYFFIFEALFVASPGKMLTQTRVSNKSGNHPGLIPILKRTLCRFIPFEAFTFLTGHNLHDKLSDTFVIREQEKGVSSSIYLWVLLPVFLSIIIFTIVSAYLN